MPSSNDAITLAAIYDQIQIARAEAEAVWGRDRLRGLVSPDLAERMARQLGRWSLAYEAAWAADRVTGDQMEAVRAAGAATARGWAAMHAAATEAGHRPLTAEVWEVGLEGGGLVAIVRDNDAAAHVLADAAGRYGAVYTLAEIGCVIDALPKAMAEAKAEWPAAKLQTPEPRDRSWSTGPRHLQGDEIPFG